MTCVKIRVMSKMTKRVVKVLNKSHNIKHIIQLRSGIWPLVWWTPYRQKDLHSGSFRIVEFNNVEDAERVIKELDEVVGLL